MSARKFFCFNISAYKNMAEDSSCHSHCDGYVQESVPLTSVFFPNQLTAGFHHTEQVFIPEHITNMIYYTSPSYLKAGRQTITSCSASCILYGATSSLSTVPDKFTFSFAIIIILIRLRRRVCQVKMCVKSENRIVTSFLDAYT